MWHEKLQTHVDQFAQASEQVRRRDVALLENQKRITQLAKDAQILRTEHTELRWNLDTVTELQYDLHTSLEQLEQELDALECSQLNVADNDSDMKRQDAYEKASNINFQLHQMSTEIKDIVEKLNNTYQSQAQADTDSPANVVLQILNKHHLSLEFLDQGTVRLAKEIHDTSKHLRVLQTQMQANATHFR